MVSDLVTPSAEQHCIIKFPCDCGRCHISKTIRPLKVCIKEHKYNLTQILLEKSKLAQHGYEAGHKICWNEAKVFHIEPNTTQEIHGIHPHVSDRPSDQSTKLGYLSHLTPVITAEVKETTTLSSVD
jgi:hypothetical protein